ncbi:sporulation protein [Saccharomonospora saliphila]|uniref:sporulation protein n=1 Tax=Saccharomonospora saliphila TaxID=369829 RepID=UPI000368B05E|nr:sporulation protein [Saccharomonospora saliphila]
MFKKLLAAVGIGGVEVETELYDHGVQPGGAVRGVIRLRAGEVQQDISGVFIELVTRVEHEADDSEIDLMRGFGRTAVAGGVVLPPGQVVEIPFEVQVPIETPITHYRDQPLRGTEVAVRTVVDISGAVDATDTDPIGVGALSAQHVVLDAVERLGFRLRSADVEWGRLPRTRQTLPFFQEIEFAGAPDYPRLSELEVTFVAGADGMDIVLESDRKAGLLAGGGDRMQVLSVDYDTVTTLDWPHELHTLLEPLGRSRF